MRMTPTERAIRTAKVEEFNAACDAIGYDAGGRSYGMPGTIVRTAYLMSVKAAKATR